MLFRSVQEDANDEMILQDDEDDNFIDLDYGDDFDDFDKAVMNMIRKKSILTNIICSDFEL